MQLLGPVMKSDSESLLQKLLRGTGAAITTASTFVPDPAGLQIGDLMILFLATSSDDPIGTGWVDLTITGGLQVWWRIATLDVNDEYETGINYFAGFSQKLAFKVQANAWDISGFGTAQNAVLNQFDISGVGAVGSGQSVVVAAGRRVTDDLLSLDSLGPHDSGLFTDATLSATNIAFGDPDHYYDAFSYLAQETPASIPFGQWDGANDGDPGSVRSIMWRWDFN